MKIKVLAKYASISQNLATKHTKYIKTSKK